MRRAAARRRREVWLQAGLPVRQGAAARGIGRGRDRPGGGGMSADQAKQLLLGHVRAVKALRDQRREINADIAERKKEARDQGFDAKRIEDVVRWQEQCEKHGRPAVDEAEAMFELYRGVVEGEGKSVAE